MSAEAPNPITVSSALIAPLYMQAAPNDPIDLGRVAVEFEHRGTKHEQEAAVTMRFDPKHRLEFGVSVESASPLFALKLFVESGGGMRGKTGPPMIVTTFRPVRRLSECGENAARTTAFSGSHGGD